MRTLMKCVGDGHFKQYEVSLEYIVGTNEVEFETAYGRIGGPQTVNTATLPDAKGLSEYTKLVASKVRKGYVVVEEEDAQGVFTSYDDPTSRADDYVYNVGSPVSVDGLESDLDDLLAGLSVKV